jgi:Ca2+-transporting ATPase
MILVDDNFATIVKAVEQGRGIFDNIKKAVHFLLSTNIGEILSVFAASLLGFSAPLIPIQLLWVNLVTDSLPAMALGTEKPEKDIMQRKPLSPSKGFFSYGLWLDITLEGLLVGTLTILAFSLGSLVFPSQNSIALGRTMAFCTLSFCEIAQAINMRSSFPLYKTGLFSNRMMNIAVVVCYAMQCVVVVIPGLASLFGVVPLSGIQWITVIALSAVPLLAGEAGKIIFNKKKT